MAYIAKAKNGFFSTKELNEMGHRAARKYATQQGIPRANHPRYSDINNHPKCTTKGCRNRKIVLEWHWTSGEPVYRPICQECHDYNTAMRYAAKNDAPWVQTVVDVIAHKNGFDSARAYLNSRHPSRWARLEYCENIDSRLGFKCTTNIIWDGMLDVDHIDENPTNDDPTNLQTLCKCCHSYKGNVFVKLNGRTPGRVSLGILKSRAK
jgi:hypothetical protein